MGDTGYKYPSPCERTLDLPVDQAGPVPIYPWYILGVFHVPGTGPVYSTLHSAFAIMAVRICCNLRCHYPADPDQCLGLVPFVNSG